VISILEHPPDNEELAFMAVEQAALVMALALIKEREVAEVEGRVRGEYLDDLVQGTFGDEAAAQRRARHLGYPLPGRHVLLIVDIDDFRGFIRARQLGEDAIQALKREFLRRVSGVIRGAYTRALLGSRSDSVMALLPLGLDAPDHLPRVQTVGQQLRDVIADWRPGFTISVGYSAPVDAPAGVTTAHREVRAVLDTLARFKRWSQVVAVPELGLTGLLAGVSDDRLVEFVNRHLGPLVEHDRARGGNLIPTLKAYLEAGEQQAAARRLRVHPNTLRYRLDRIREISGAELDDAETRLNLAVALRVQGLLGL
jgi:sugar diacid utilization regulator